LIAIDPVEVRKILIDAARARTLLTYSQALGLLGHRFTRLLMRQLCSVLDAIDEDGQAADEPGPAVLVVRQSDRLPGQGWFVSRSQSGEGFRGTGKGLCRCTPKAGLQLLGLTSFAALPRSPFTRSKSIKFLQPACGASFEVYREQQSGRGTEFLRGHAEEGLKFADYMRLIEVA